MRTCAGGLDAPAVVASVQRQRDAFRAERAARGDPDGAVVGVPEALRLRPPLQRARLEDAVLTPLDLDPARRLVRPRPDAVRGAEALAAHAGPTGALALVVRRPGCGLCRRQALALAALVERDDRLAHGFGLFAVVKETGVDDDGLLEFHRRYFPFPTYCDRSWAFYAALGNRRVGLGAIWNPATIRSVFCESFRRDRIHGNGKGEGLLQGGIVMFDRDCRPRAAYLEETGADLPIRDILAAIYAMENEEAPPP